MRFGRTPEGGSTHGRGIVAPPTPLLALTDHLLDGGHQRNIRAHLEFDPICSQGGGGDDLSFNCSSLLPDRLLGSATTNTSTPDAQKKMPAGDGSNHDFGTGGVHFGTAPIEEGNEEAVSVVEPFPRAPPGFQLDPNFSQGGGDDLFFDCASHLSDSLPDSATTNTSTPVLEKQMSACDNSNHNHSDGTEGFHFGAPIEGGNEEAVSIIERFARAPPGFQCRQYPHSNANASVAASDER